MQSRCTRSPHNLDSKTQLTLSRKWWLRRRKEEKDGPGWFLLCVSEQAQGAWWRWECSRLRLSGMSGRQLNYIGAPEWPLGLLDEERKRGWTWKAQTQLIILSSSATTLGLSKLAQASCNYSALRSILLAGWRAWLESCLGGSAWFCTRFDGKSAPSSVCESAGELCPGAQMLLS